MATTGSPLAQSCNTPLPENKFLSSILKIGCFKEQGNQMLHLLGMSSKRAKAAGRGSSCSEQLSGRNTYARCGLLSPQQSKRIQARPPSLWISSLTAQLADKRAVISFSAFLTLWPCTAFVFCFFPPSLELPHLIQYFLCFILLSKLAKEILFG